MSWLHLFRRRRPELTNASLSRALELAAQGRRAAIYERRTGLYAFWYLQLRVDEELIRAARNGTSLYCLSVWTENPEQLDLLVTSARECIRPYDLAAYLDNGHVALILLDATSVVAHVVMHRVVVAAGEGLDAGVSCSPVDGNTLAELLERAKARAAPVNLAL